MRLEGPDWRTFLQGLLSQDVETLAQGEIRFGALLNPQGKLLFDLFLIGGESGCLIDVAADRREDFIRRLTMYRLRGEGPGRGGRGRGAGAVARKSFVIPAAA